MFWLKACRRCSGDLYETHDIEGPYIKCLQCGRELPADEERALRAQGTGVAARRPAAHAA